MSVAVRCIGFLPRAFGLGGLDGATQRGLLIAFSTSIAAVMGTQLVYPSLPAMVGQLHVEQAAIGLVITAYTLPAVFLTPVAGAFADLHGRRPLLFGGLLVFGLAGAAVSFAPSFQVVLALRAVQGLGATALSPLTIVLLSDLVPEHQEGSAQGAKVVLDRVATSIGPILAGVLAAVAWGLPFLLYALAVPVAFLGLAWLPETRPSNAPGLRAYVGGFGAVVQRPRLFVAFAAGSLRFFLDYGYFTYLPIYLAVARHARTDEIGVLLAVYAVGSMLTASQAGRLARGRDPAAVLFAGFALSGLSVLAVPFAASDLLVGLSLFVYGLGNGLISPLQKGLLTRNAPEAVRGGVISLDRVLQQIAKSAAPAAMGALLVVADVTAVFWVLGGLSLVSVVLAAVVLPTWARRPGRLAA
jgi:predicted MFS family arabinose efflux permease